LQPARIILLAAGQGTRMQALGGDIPKSLLPILGEPFVVRLARQARAHGVDDITVVVGYQAERVEQAISSVVSGVRFVLNARYDEDVNIHSLWLALQQDSSPFIVVEADIYLHDCAWPILLSHEDTECSVWYTRGQLQKHRTGGILSADANRKMTDLRIVKTYENRWAEYKKLVGVTRVASTQIEMYLHLLNEYHQSSFKQYYLQPWIDSLDRLPAFERDLGAEYAVSVNTPKEYLSLIEKLNHGLS